MMIELGKRYTTQNNHRTVVVTVVEAEQDINRDRRKWVCRNEETGRRLRRTGRQLHPIDAP
jgi:hypothetical protein